MNSKSKEIDERFDWNSMLTYILFYSSKFDWNNGLYYVWFDWLK